MKYSVITFGCRVNQADSLGFEEGLLARGGVAVAPEQAELVIVNTCSVTATADQGARQTIRRVARENPTARIVVTGCYATRRPEDLQGLPNVVRVVSNGDKPLMVSFISPNERMTTASRFGEGDGSCGAAVVPGVAGRTAFTLRVQTGCAETCSYCIIPSTRGGPRSSSVDAVLAEIARVTDAGFKEIALTGVHLGSYGRDLVPSSSLIELLRAVRLKADATHDDASVRLQPDVLFRISSLEPMDCSREIVDLVAAGECFAPHFHLPLQHASNRVLAAMRRPYTIEYYASLVDVIRSRMPHASIGSDVIVGFPGETDADFEQLASYLEASPLTHVHVFPYSDRPGTDATRMNGKVDGVIVRERGRRVRDIAQQLAGRFRESQAGTIRPALTIEDGSSVVTDNYLKLRVSPGRARNEWVRVRIKSHNEGELL
jgi:threonylcarbamoyladenosine tRNA methylthiotransferase MtaB